jgi:hypothetical protein
MSVSGRDCAWRKPSALSRRRCTTKDPLLSSIKLFRWYLGPAKGANEMTPWARPVMRDVGLGSNGRRPDCQTSFSRTRMNAHNLHATARCQFCQATPVRTSADPAMCSLLTALMLGKPLQGC